MPLSLLSSLEAFPSPPKVKIGSSTVTVVEFTVVVVPFTIRSPPTVTVPVVVTVSINASFHLTPVVPKSTSLSVSGPNIPSATYTCSALFAYKCISFTVSKSILVSSSSPILISVASRDVTVVWAAFIAKSIVLSAAW